MTLEQIVVTRETAEKLRAAGYRAETCFGWWYDDPTSPDDPAHGVYGEWKMLRSGLLQHNPGWLPAPTASELMEEMPDWLSVYRVMDGTGWAACHIGEDVYELAPTPADALAMLWIELNRKDKP
jgi:hypothetical protein